MKAADYIAQKLANIGVNHVFMITGGGAMFLNDAIGKEKRLKYICNMHEQACAMSAEGYARTNGKMSVVCVTSGPGGTNAITGVLGQWMDSIPVLYLSGQVRFATTIKSTDLPLRQLGDQEGPITEIVRPITKYAFMLKDPKSVRYHLEKAIYLATSGRPGPVWLDIPLDVQSAEVDESEMPAYDSNEDLNTVNPVISDTVMDEVIARLEAAERPVILAGAGVRLSGSANRFFKMAEKLGIPVQVAWDAIDLFPSDHPLYAGRPSTMGQRAANFIFQNADLLLNLGCRLNVRQIGYNFDAVARAAFKISVDIDAAELQKPTLKIDLPIHANVSDFIDKLSSWIAQKSILPRQGWLNWCKERLHCYPPVEPSMRKADKPVNPYVFSEVLGMALGQDDIVVSSNGSSCVMPIQAMSIRRGQRHIVNSGSAAMGFGLPAAIGACFGGDGRRVICLEGDGSLQMNIQELETVVYHNLPLKIFVFNNTGYLSMHLTQVNFFQGRFTGESAQSGVGFPDFTAIAQAYGLNTFSVDASKELAVTIEKALAADGPVLCDVKIDPDQIFQPRSSSRQLPDGRIISSTLEDLFPFLPEEEFLSNMIIPQWVSNNKE